MTPTTTDQAVFANHVERAKAILAGRYEPEPLAMPPDLQEWWDAQVRGFDPPATAEVIAYQHNRLLLVEHSAGQDVVYTVTDRGTLAILAVGLDETRELFRFLNADERKRATSALPGVSRWS